MKIRNQGEFFADGKNLNTVLFALEVYEKQELPQIVEDEAQEEQDRVTAIKEFLNHVLNWTRKGV